VLAEAMTLDAARALVFTNIKENKYIMFVLAH